MIYETASSVTLAPTSVLAGLSSVATVTISGAAPNGGAVVSMSSQSSGSVTMPATVTIPAGSTSTTVAVTPAVQASNYQATITAAYNGSSASAVLTAIRPVFSVSVSPSQVNGGSGSVGTVSLGTVAPYGGYVVALSSSNPTTVVVPSSVTVPGGSVLGTFNISTLPTPTNYNCLIVANPGPYQVTATLTVLAAPVTMPINLTATPGDQLVNLSWSTLSGATSYGVFRSTINGGPYTQIASGVTSTAYTDTNGATGLTNGTTYYYVVNALTSVGTSGYSNQAGARPFGGRNILSIVPNPPLGFLSDALNLPDWMQDAIPTDQSDAPGGGPAAPFSISLPFGEVDFNPPPDLVVQDSQVGTISFGVSYRSALAAGNVSSPGLPAGWTHNWDYRVVPLQSGTWGPLQLVYPSGASETLNPVMNGNSPTGAFTTPIGAPYSVTGTPDPNVVGLWDQVVIQYAGNSQDVYGPHSGDSIYRLSNRVYSDHSQVTLTYTGQTLASIAGGSNAISLSNSGQSFTASPPSGLPITYEFSAHGIEWISNAVDGSERWNFGYINIGNNLYLLNQVTTANHTASVQYDPSTGCANSLTDGNGNTRSYSYNGNSSAVVNVGNDSKTESSDVLGRVTSWTDAANKTSTFQYNDPQAPGGVTLAISPTNQQIAITHDSNGNPIKVVYPWGNYTILQWSYPTGFPNGQLTSSQEYGKDGTSNPATIYTYYTAQNAVSQASVGFVQTITRPNGGVTTYTYTTAGSVYQITAPNASGTPATTTYYYSPNGEAIDKPIKVIDPIGNITNYGYDTAGRLSSVTDPMNSVLSATFDALNEPSHLTLPDGSTIGYNYDVPGTPPINRQIMNAGNSAYLDSIVHDGEYAPSSLQGASMLSSSRTYTPEYLLSQLTNGNTVPMHSFSWAPTTNTQTYTVGSGSSAAIWSQVLDGDGNLNTFTTPLGSGNASFSSGKPTRYYATNSNAGTDQTLEITNQYDAFGRVSWTQNDTSGYTHQYTYDGEDNVISDTVWSGGIGTTIDSIVSYTYSAGDGVTSKTISIPYAGDSVLPVTYTYGYDLDSNVTSIALSANGNAIPGTGVTYHYRSDNLVDAVRTPQATTLYGYDALGRVTSVQNLTADGVIDDPNNVSSMDPVVTDPIDGSSHNTFSSFGGISYDPVGNRKGMTFWFRAANSYGYGSGTVGWSVDGYQNGQAFLIEEGWTSPQYSAITVPYGMDAGGNLTSVRGTSSPVDTNTDELTADSYDAAGDSTTFHLLYGAPCTAVYDGGGEVTSLTLNGGTDAIALDSLGFRITKQLLGSPSSDDLYVYDGSSLSARWWTASTTSPHSKTLAPTSSFAATFYVWGPTGVIQEVTESASGSFSNSLTYTYDPQGNTVQRIQTYQAGAGPGYSPVDLATVYDAYGLDMWGLGTDVGTGKPDLNNQIFLYKGQYGCVTDTETNLVYCHHRYYNPYSARWLTRDPAGLEGGINTYQYCEGNPLVSVDPSGLSRLLILLGEAHGWYQLGVQQMILNRIEKIAAAQGYKDLSEVDSSITHEQLLHELKSADGFIYIGHGAESDDDMRGMPDANNSEDNPLVLDRNFVSELSRVRSGKKLDFTWLIACFSFGQEGVWKGVSHAVYTYSNGANQFLQFSPHMWKEKGWAAPKSWANGQFP